MKIKNTKLAPSYFLHIHSGCIKKKVVLVDEMAAQVLLNSSEMKKVGMFRKIQHNC